MAFSLPDDLVPRRYQEEVFERALEGNIIAALDTGSGKTLISLLLIKWISAQAASVGKVIIFLVPKVTLVEQQGNFISQNTPLRVMKLYGALDIDLSDRPGWSKRFAQNDVFVMTAQIFLNMLTHSIWGIDRVSLMIFDECHHARKNHPYNGIMREYFQVVPTARRPKIFGMTASPIWDSKDPVGSLAKLEANMDAKVIGVRAYIEELAEHSPKPAEIVREYSFPPEEYDYPYPTIWLALGTFDSKMWADLDIPWNNIGTRYYATLSNLGPYAASYFLYIEMRQHVLRVQKEYHDATITINYNIDLGLPCQTSLEPLPPEFLVVQDILHDFELFFSDDLGSDNIPITVSLSWCTPKVRTLVDILLAYYSPTFQGIIFVEQRQVAACLAKILPAIPELKAIIRSGSLVGQGVGKDGVPKTAADNQTKVVELFRKGIINLLIATSVAEEGLDFPACDLVVRFDSLQHMVGYVQSRGRARNKASTFIVMIPKDDTSHHSRYKALKEGEPEVNRAYQIRQEQEDNRDHSEDDDASEDEETSPVDLIERERYVVASSGAVLTYDNSITLLNYLCALIPRDKFTPVHVPRFTGDFEVTLHLPPSLPLSSQNLMFVGPPRRSKKEARRAAAFMAVKRLYQLDVFDQYLLPTASAKSKVNEDIDGRSVSNVNQIPNMMNIQVRDPWIIGPRLWLHTIYLNDRPAAGLVTGTMLPTGDVLCGRELVRIGQGVLMQFGNEEDDKCKRESMQQFTTRGIWFRVTARPLTSPPSCFIVPLDLDNHPDWDAINRLIANPYGTFDWSNIGEHHYDSLIVMNVNEFGRPRLLHKIRFDLTPMSKPPPGSSVKEFSTYHALFVDKWTRKKWIAQVPTNGPLVETLLLPRSFNGSYPMDLLKDDEEVTVPNGSLVPQGCLRWIVMSRDVSRAFEVLPVLCHRITDIYRAQCARFVISLPPIRTNFLIEALTIPAANAGYNNQRMETLGDAVLELCTTVYLFNKYPHRHEGQLSALRQNTISNRYLLARAKEIDLERFITSETQNLRTWRYVRPLGNFWAPLVERSISRCYPRRSLQDCMEAILGAAFLTGGIPMALHAGEALGLAFGGTLPWSLRYSRRPDASPASALFSDLEESLGYKFHRSELLLEAVTHPSFVGPSGGPSYQRLEFLGDALLDLVVVHYLYKKFPEATSAQLAWPKSRAICAPALASLAVRRLGLHKIILANRVDLSEAINHYVPLLQAATGEDIVKRGWSYDPPKAISDIFESVMGAVLVDSAFNYERAAAVVEYVMEDVLAALIPSLPRDPVSELVVWLATSGCTKVTFQKKQKLQNGIQRDGMAVLVHKIVVIGPIVAASLSVAKFVASERALAILADAESEKSLARLCTCSKAPEVRGVANAEDITVVGDNNDEPTELIAAEKAMLVSDIEEAEEVTDILTRDEVDLFP